MSYYGDGNSGPLDDVFVKAAVEVKRFLPSLFNIKVVGILKKLINRHRINWIDADN